MPTSEIKKLNTHTIHTVVSNTPNVNTVSALSLNGEVDPIFRNSVAYTITQQDVDNWNAGAGVDLSAYVTKLQLTEMSYVTKSELSAQSYLTNETEPAFNNSPAATITTEDIQNWNTGAAIDLSSYVTYDYLSAQSYLTNETEPAFNASPAASITTEDIENWDRGGSIDLSSYVTYDYLSAQSYLQTETEPAFNASPAATITLEDIQKWDTGSGIDLSSYVTKSDLVAQSYIQNESDPIFSASPAASITDTDIANWNAAAGTIDMSAYVTKNELVAQSYIQTETEPAFNNSPAATITTEDIQNWNSGGSVDLSSYVTYDYLSEQSYVKHLNDDDQMITVTYDFPDNVTTHRSIRIVTDDIDDSYYASFISEVSKYHDNTYSVHSAMRAGAGNIISSVGVSDRGIILQTLSGEIMFSSPNIKMPYKNETSFVASYDYIADVLNEQSYLKFVPEAEPNRYHTPLFNGTYSIHVQGPGESGADTSAIQLYTTYTYDNISHTAHIGIYRNATEGITDINNDKIWLSGNTSVNYNGNLSPVASYQYVADVLNAQSYVTPSQLTGMSYITKSELAAQSYVSSTELINMSYVTKNDLVAQSYIQNESDPIFNASPAAGITAQDIQNWNTGAAIDLSSYVTYDYLSAQSYLTNETEPAFNNSPAASITSQDITNWNTGALIDLSTYVTKQQLSNQSYVTNWTNDNDQIITVSSDFTTADTKRRAGIRTRSEDATYCASFISSIENNYGNTYYVYAGVEANYGEDKKSGIYATNAGVGLTALDGNIRLASPNIRMDYKNKVSFVASYDYVGETLAAQSYITINDVVFPDYSDTYQAVGDYVTPAQLSGQSYIKADYLTTNRYLKSSYAFTGATSIYTEGMSIYNGNVFPSSFSYTGVNDTTYYDTFASIRTMKKYVAGFLADVLPNYTTKTELDAQSYVTSTALSGMSYTSVQIVTEAQYEDRQDNILYVISDAEPVSDLITRAELMTILANYMPKPDIIYETDGTTGLLGENANSMNLTNWQLQNLDFTPYRYVLAFIKQADLPLSGTNNQYATPALVVYIPLDAASKSTQYNAYIGSTGGTNMNDPDVHFIVQCAIDSTKTKFKVVNEGSVAGTIWGDRNNNGRYCYKIEGYK